MQKNKGRNPKIHVDIRGSIADSTTSSAESGGKRLPKFTQLDTIASVQDTTEEFIRKLAEAAKSFKLADVNIMLSTLHFSDNSSNSDLDKSVISCQAGESQESLSGLVSIISYINLKAAVCQ